MAQKNRSKEIWLIPKRVNLHQTICLIDGIIERNYSGTSWNETKQNNLGVNLKNWGATNSGKNISHQALRTLLASIPQYLGFLYINTSSTPSSIILTDAGKKIWDNHKESLVKIKNLRDGKKELITQSDVLLEQMEKLIITNPIILKDCEDILVFPFRLILRLLLVLEYLDREELAYIVFKIKDESEFDLALEELKNFRKLEFSERERLMAIYKKSHHGNITLVKASSAGYFESLCLLTGIISKLSVTIPNPNNDHNKKVTAIKIKHQYLEYVNFIVTEKYKHSDIYDFGNNLQLWIDYIGNPNRLNPPQDIFIHNKSSLDMIVCIRKNGLLLDGDLVEPNSFFTYPMFIDEHYEIECIDINGGNIIKSVDYISKYGFTNVNINITEDHIPKVETIDMIKEDIIELSLASNFNTRVLNYLSILYNIDGRSRENDKYLRGAYYEYLFYKLLTILLENGTIDDVIWNGRIGKYGLPSPAPGGVQGTPDIIFTISDNDYILEVTTIKPKAFQFKAEGASVPDHVRLFKSSTTNNVIGIFCAPIIHDRNTSIMQSSLSSENITLKCINDTDLLDILCSNNREFIVNNLK